MYLAEAEELHRSTVSSSLQKKRKSHAEFQDKALALIDNIRLFDKGLSSVKNPSDKVTFQKNYTYLNENERQYLSLHNAIGFHVLISCCMIISGGTWEIFDKISMHWPCEQCLCSHCFWARHPRDIFRFERRSTDETLGPVSQGNFRAFTPHPQGFSK